MKRSLRIITVTVLALTMIFATAGTALAAERQITTTGKGIIRVQPDIANISLSIETIGNTSEKAQKENNKIAAAVISKLKEMNISEESIVDGYCSVYPQYSYNDETGKRTISGFEANRSLNVEISDIDNAGAYIDAALSAGATGFYSISFSLEDPSAYYGQALQAAVKNASLSAEAIAKACQKTMGDVISVTEHSSGYSYESYSAEEAMAVADMTAGGSNSVYSTTISYNDIEVTAYVTAVYGF